MARIQVVRRGELLARMEPGPKLTSKIRENALRLVATLLLEAVDTTATVTEVTEAGETEGIDEQDRA